MDRTNLLGANATSEINLKSLVEKIWKKKFLYAFSIGVCVFLAMVKVKTTTPMYRASTTLFIDASGQTRSLGKSKYVEDGVGLIETEKNLTNEINVIKSYNLVLNTIKELDFQISYYASNWYKTEESYRDAPYVVQLIDTSAQMYGTPFHIEFLSEDQFQLSVEVEEYAVYDPKTQNSRSVESEFKFTQTYSFGEPIRHEYFNFIVNKPTYAFDLGDYEGKKLFFIANSITSLARSYQGNLEVNQLDMKSSILKLEAVGPVPAKEVAFLNKVAENYIKEKLSERDEIAASKEDFIRGQLANFSDSLALAEVKLESFKRNAGAIDLNQTATHTLTNIQQLQSQKAQQELNIKYYNSLLQYITDSAGVDKIIAPSVVGINDPLLNENLLEFKRLHTEKTNLAYYKGAKSHDLKMINQQIANNKYSLQENIRNLIASAQLSLTDLHQRIGQSQAVITQIPGNEKQLINYERLSTHYENLYNYLSQELAKAGIARAEDIADTKILDQARVEGGGPISPNAKIMLALGFLVGLILPTSWILYQETFDERIETKEELESFSNIPIAASIAQSSNKKKFDPTDLAQWQTQESFRDLSASLQFLIPDENKNIIGMISTIPGEGKTFCATNMGIYLVRGGKKVLYIDADFRKPSVLRNSDGFQNTGFSKFLRGEISAIEEVIQKHKDLENFHYISSHIEEDNPHRLLSSPRMEILIESVKDQYDYIIFDTPALGIVSDYLLISKYIDVHLFVARRNITKFSFLKDMDKIRKKGQLDNSYMIFNGALGKDFKYGMSYYDYYQKAPKKNIIKKILSI